MSQPILAVIGVGNMAKSVIAGILRAQLPLSKIIVYDTNSGQYQELPNDPILETAPSAHEAVADADMVLLAVKPQNYPELLAELALLPKHASKLYISIAAGISSESVSVALSGACVIRVLPNVPMLIGQGVSIVCENSSADASKFSFVCDIFRSAGSVLLIDESEMNRMISVTSSSPAYVFRFIQAIYQGALRQDLPDRELLNAICDMVIGSAQLLKESSESPEMLIARVASKGGTTERALATLDTYGFNEIIAKAMLACTARAEELGKASNEKTEK